MNEFTFDVGGNIVLVIIIWVFRALVIAFIVIPILYFTIKYFYRKSQRQTTDADLVKQFRGESTLQKIIKALFG